MNTSEKEVVVGMVSPARAALLTRRRIRREVNTLITQVNDVLSKSFLPGMSVDIALPYYDENTRTAFIKACSAQWDVEAVGIRVRQTPGASPVTIYRFGMKTRRLAYRV